MHRLSRLLAVTFVIAVLLLAASRVSAQSLTDSRMFQSPTPVTLAASGLQLPAGKVAVIDFRVVAEKSLVGKRVLTQLQTFQNAKGAEIQGLQTQLQSLQSKRQTQAAVVTESVLADMDRDIGKLARTLQHAQDDAQAEYQELRAQLMADLQRKVDAMVASVAKEKEILLVLEADSTVYFSPTLDLSDEVVKRLDEQAKTAG
jgi:Skp family chaperone for outer membrane proteins